jgi:XTP/dITP diphosphohydrolase
MPEGSIIVWFATGNTHKKQELSAIFTAAGGPDVLIKIPAEGGIENFDPEETGSTFLENSLIKARALHGLLRGRGSCIGYNGPVIADDSGLCVDALGGRPGIYSARYAGRHTVRYGGRYGGRYSGPGSGEKLSAGERNRLLLEELGDSVNRGARFVCAMTLLFDEDRFFCVQETLEGEIVKPGARRGGGGFGYDPILYIPALGRTVAELGEEEKNLVSHRGKAARITAKLLCQN